MIFIINFNSKTILNLSKCFVQLGTIKVFRYNGSSLSRNNYMVYLNIIIQCGIYTTFQIPDINPVQIIFIDGINPFAPVVTNIYLINFKPFFLYFL